MTILTQDELKQIDVESLLDTQIDDIPLPADFVTPPPGYYRLGITKVEQKTIGANDLDGVSLNFVVLETMELNKKDDTEVAVESLFSVFYAVGFGLAALAKECKPIYGDEKITLRELIERLDGMEVYAVITNRKDKYDPERKYAGVKQLTPV
jgi:hypothetical protein